MALQKIQLPDNMGVNRGLDVLRESLRDYTAWQRQAAIDLRNQQMLDDEKKRRLQAEKQAALLKGDELRAAKRHDLAAQILAPFYDAQSAQEEIPGEPQSQQPAGGSPVPDQIEFGGTQYSGKDIADIFGHMGQQVDPAKEGPVSFGGTPYQAQDLEAIGMGPDLLREHPNPIIAANEANRPDLRMKNNLAAEKRYRALFNLTDKDTGEKFTLQDPQEAAAQRIAPIEQAVQQSGDPIAIEAFGQIRPWLLSGKVDTGDALEFINNAKKTKAAADAAVLKKEQEHQEKLEDRRYARDEFLFREAERAKRPPKPFIINGPQEASGANAVLTGIRSEVKDFLAPRNYELITKDLTSLEGALRGIDSGNSKAVQAALYGYGKSVAGPGTFSQPEQDFIINRTGGTWEQIQTAIKQVESGTYSPEAVRIFREAINVKLGGLRNDMKQIHTDFVEKFRRGHAFQNVQQNMVDEERALFGRYGVDVEAAPEGAGGVSYGTPRMMARPKGNKPSAPRAMSVDDAMKLYRGGK